MKKLLFTLMFTLPCILYSVAQELNPYDNLVINLLEEFGNKPSDLQSYVVNGKVLVQVDNKNVTLTDFSKDDITFLIGNFSDLDMTSPFLEITNLTISKHKREGEILGRNGEQHHVKLQTVSEQDRTIEKSANEEQEAFSYVLDYLFMTDDSELSNGFKNIIQDNVLYVDLIQRTHLADYLSYKGFQVVFIKPSSQNIEKCRNKYIQILNYEVSKSNKSISLTYRLINENIVVYIMQSSCKPCKGLF